MRKEYMMAYKIQMRIPRTGRQWHDIQDQWRLTSMESRAALYDTRADAERVATSLRSEGRGKCRVRKVGKGER